MTTRLDKETKKKVDEHEQQLVNFNDLCIHPGFNSLPNSSIRTLKSMTKRAARMLISKCTVWRWLYGDNNNLLVKTFPRSLTGAVFTELEISKV